MILLVLYTTVFLNIAYGNPNKEIKTKNKKILFISSYGPNFASYDMQIKGLENSIGSDSNIQIEYMDSGEFLGEENELNFYNLLKYKINKYKKFDIVILADDHALEFGKKYRYELFKDTPIVFLGANNIKSAKDAIKLDNVYGIIERVPIKENVDIISKLHKGKNIVALVYNKSEDSQELKDFYDLQAKYKDLNFKHISLGDISLDNFKDEVNKLTKDDILLSIYCYKSDYSEFEKMLESNHILSFKNDIIKYTTLDYILNNEYLGGIVVSNYKLGNMAGNVAKSILNGNIPKNKLSNIEDVYTSVFNYPQLKKYNIKESKLPEKSQILEKKVSVWQKHKIILIPTIIVTSCLVGTVVVLFINVKKRSVYESEILKAKEIAESINIAQSNFISNISHELRTPVAVIMSSNQLLNLKLKRISNNNLDIKELQNESNTNIINQNCYRLLRLINNIVDVAKVDSGFMTMKLKNVEVVSLLESLVLSVVPYAESKNLDIIFDTEEEEIIMSVDPDKIERIVLNLLSNAIKFSKKSGQISVTVSKNLENLVFEVKDSGIGISEKNIERIFDKFIQVEDQQVKKNEGSGIGLSLVKSFVNLHNGSIDVKSEYSSGTTFTVQIPININEGKKIYTYNIYDIQGDIMGTSIEFSDI